MCEFDVDRFTEDSMKEMLRRIEHPYSIKNEINVHPLSEKISLLELTQEAKVVKRRRLMGVRSKSSDDGGK